MYSFLKLNIIKSMHIHTDTNGLGQFNKSQDVLLLNVMQCKILEYFKWICSFNKRGESHRVYKLNMTLLDNNPGF